MDKLTLHVLLRQALHLMSCSNEAIYACRDVAEVQREMRALREAVIDLRPYTNAVIAHTSGNGGATTRRSATARQRRLKQ